MSLLQMLENDVVSIDAIKASGALKERLSSLGVTTQSEVQVKRFGLFKSTVQIMVNRSLIALRKNEAKLIEVHKI